MNPDRLPATSTSLERYDYPSDEEHHLIDPVSTPMYYSQPPGMHSGRMSGRSIYCSNRELLLLSTINLVGSGALATFAYFLAKEYQSLNPEMTGTAVYQMSIAVVLRALIESNIAVLKKEGQDPYLIEKVMNYFSRFSLEGYLILWNLYNNIYSVDKVGGNVVYAMLQVWCIFNAVGDGVNLFKLNRGHRRETIQIIDERAVVNPRMFPSPQNMIGQGLTYLSSAALGAVLITLGEVYKNNVKGMELLTYCLGSLFVTSGVGYFSMEGFLRLWKHYEVSSLNFNPEWEDGSLNSEARIPWKLKLLRTTAKAAQEFLTEFVCVSSLVVPPYFYFPISGVAYGAMGNIREKRFGYLSNDVLTGERLESYEAGTQVKRTAVRVNQVSTGIFFLLYTLFFIYALIATNDDGRIDIAVLLASTYGSALLSRWLYHSFIPGENGRSVNEGAYRLLHNIYCLLPPYFALSTVSSIDNSSSNGSSAFGFAAGLGATAFSGTMIGINQTREFREFGFTPALFRTLVLNLFLYIFAGPTQR